MYFVTVVLLMALLPAGSIYVEHSVLHSALPLVALAGKWFVFWGAGVRLLLAGIRQLVQPTFTARQIFHMQSDEALPVIRELGVANLAAGFVGLASLSLPSFVLPMAIYAGVYYGIAGLRHMMEKGRSMNETIAMVSDIWVAAIYATYVACMGLAVSA